MSNNPVTLLLLLLILILAVLIFSTASLVELLAYIRGPRAAQSREQILRGWRRLVG
jgi:hypothetical protein